MKSAKTTKRKKYEEKRKRTIKGVMVIALVVTIGILANQLPKFSGEFRGRAAGTRACSSAAMPVSLTSFVDDRGRGLATTFMWKWDGDTNDNIKTLIRISETKSEVDFGCPHIMDPPGTDPTKIDPTKCIVKEDNLPKNATTFSATGLKGGNTVYWWRVVGFKDAGCFNSEDKSVDMCLAGTPLQMRAQPLTTTSALLEWSWSTFQNTKSFIRISETKSEVDLGCPHGVGSDPTQCIIKKDDLSPTATSFTATGLKSGATYWWRVVGFTPSCYRSDDRSFLAM